MKKLLLTGASGFLGWQICQAQLKDWQLIGTWHQNKHGLFPKLPHYQIDLSKKDHLWQMLKETRPDALFHLAANSSTAGCEKAPGQSFPINVEATENLAKMCAERNVKFLFTSSEQVFDGSGQYYLETDPPQPQNEYGKQKWEAEKRVAALGTEAAIVRVAVMFGKGSPASSSFLESWVSSWVKQLPVTAFHDEVRSFLSGQSAAEGLLHLLRQGAAGLFHLGGKEALSRTDFAQMAARIFDLPKAKINSISQKEVDLSTYRPPDLSLDCGKIKGTGLTLRSVGAELERLKDGFDFRASARLN